MVKAIQQCVFMIVFGVLAFNCPADGPAKATIDRSGFDTSVKPGDDFFEYVDGGWIKSNPIPPQYGQWGIYSELHQRNEISPSRDSSTIW